MSLWCLLQTANQMCQQHQTKPNMILLAKPKKKQDACTTVENVRINCSTHKTLKKVRVSQGSGFIVKSFRVIYNTAPNEHLAVASDPRNNSATDKCIIITALPFILSPSHRGLSSNRKQTHSCRNEAGCKAELCQVWGMWSHSKLFTRLCCTTPATAWLMMKSCFSTVNSWTDYYFICTLQYRIHKNK